MFRIDWNAVQDALMIMGKGMLGIFVGTIVMILIMVLLNKFTTRSVSALKAALSNINVVALATTTE